MTSVKFERDTFRGNMPMPGNGQMPNMSNMPNMPNMPNSNQMPNMQNMANNMPNMPSNMQNVPNNMPNMPSNMQNMPNMPRDGNPRDFVHEVAHDLGERLTGGETTTGYLQFYLKQLESDPLRTKMLTSGSLAGLQEFLASWIAKDRARNGSYFSSRVPKMMAYGAFIAAPLGHWLVKILQKAFAGRTSLRAKVMQILVSNLIVSPIQNIVYLTSMALIAGARTFHQVRATVHAGFWPVMKVSWITSPIALAFAQKFLPESTWVPFFNLIGFVIGTYINAHTKKKRLAALRRKYEDDRRSDYGSRPGGPY